MNVAVLLSGGVDSAVVVHRLKEQGILILRVSTDFRLKSYLSIGNIGTMSWNMLCER